MNPTDPKSLDAFKSLLSPKTRETLEDDDHQTQARKLLDWARDHHPDPEALEAMVRERDG